MRVHVIDPLRDLVGAEYAGPANWTLWAALQKVAEEGTGVVVILANHESSRTTGLYDRRGDQIKLDEVERIGI